ncbi:MAG: endonuclease domain-containing protein [Spirochaetes bacterium]|nr:MAG: endonuclease domain-containing protein [Spirochaetota bacterium]
MRKNPTAAEKKLWEELKEKRFDGLKFRNQHPVFRYILDFYCHEKKLAIEVDGDIHINQKETDAYREDYLKSLGIVTVRVKNIDIEDRIEEVLIRIRSELRDLY